MERLLRSLFLLGLFACAIVFNQNCSVPAPSAPQYPVFGQASVVNFTGLEKSGYYEYRDASLEFSLFESSLGDHFLYDYRRRIMLHIAAGERFIKIDEHFSLENLRTETSSSGRKILFTLNDGDRKTDVEVGATLFPRRIRPTLKQIFSHDGDFLFETSQSTEYNPQAYIRELGRTSFETISVNSYSGVRYYYTGRTEDQSRTFGFRSYNDTRVRRARELFDLGNDPLDEFAEAIGKNGKKFVLDFRISDAHYADEPSPQNYPWTPEILAERWRRGESVSDLTIGNDRLPETEDHSRLLDFARTKVREEILGEMLTAIDRYSSRIDGFQIDFTRYPVLFKFDEGLHQRELLTNLLLRVRERLDQVERNQNRPVSLLVRVSPTLLANMNAGIDLYKWLGMGLIDAVVPSPIMSLSDEFDENLIQLSSMAGVTYYGSLMGKMPFGNYTLDDIRGDVPVNSATASFWRSPAEAFIRNARNRGVQHFEVFNWQFDDLRMDYLDSIFDPGRSVPEYFFSVPRMYYPRSMELFFQDARLDLPANINSGSEKVWALYVGLPPAEMESRLITLRIGLTDDPIPNRVLVKLNGADLGVYGLKDTLATPTDMVSVTGNGYFQGTNQGVNSLFVHPHRLAATKYLYFVGVSAKLFMKGKNLISILPSQTVGVVSIDLMIR